MFRNFFYFLVVVFLFSCYHENREEVQAPEHLLTKEEMVDIITDIQITEGALTYRRTKRLELKYIREAMYRKVFEEHGITPTILHENYDYYNSDPKEMEDIYESVLAKLSRMQSETNSNSKENPKEEID